MIKGFSESFFAKLLNYNDPRVEAYADNLYEKIRQLGILPSFVVRDKLVRFRNDIIDKSVTPPTFVKDNRFTFGYAYRGQELGTTGNFLNIGNVWEFEFEFCIDNIAGTDNLEFMGGEVIVMSDFDVVVSGSTFTNTGCVVGKVNKVKINRVHDIVTLMVNDVAIGSQTLSSDNDTVFDTIYKLN